ncbi:MAG: hypothetical protein LPK19_09235, partial [Hymenobacteraceae bacterium]|nr:hypothetical protein [Hymenobacteraceae bacterium]MDX5396406.1 hypothetical protein [Hymenobacteraceae bacterium]MDX5512468.1 hypothetical protein [Hymenobacteraceae bacterium]
MNIKTKTAEGAKSSAASFSAAGKPAETATAGGIPVLAWVIMVTLALIWGTSFILIKKGLVVYSSGELGALRIF